jgi:hypothetical protein
MKRRRAGDDTGASLAIALIIVTVFGLVLGSVLTYSSSGSRAIGQLRDRTAVNLAADGATDAAINAIRNSTYLGAPGHCFGSSDTLNLASFYGSRSATVTCTPGTNSNVRIACDSASKCNRPGTAILTLGNSSLEDGIRIVQSGARQFRVRGPVVSNSTVLVVGATSLATNGGVFSREGPSTCTGTMTTDTVPLVVTPCQPSAGHPLSADPSYAPAVSAVPTYQKVPACPTGSVVTFTPGYYDDAVALTALTGGSCVNKIWWFQPGSYYFDFHNGENVALSGSSKTWTIQNGWVIGGTLSGKFTIPGSCINPIESESAEGVQFMFGGESQLVLGSDLQAELCGSYRADRPPIVLYGMKSGTETNLVANLTMGTIVDTGQFASVDKMASRDGAAAFWNKTSANAQTGSATISGFRPTTPIPAGSNLLSAKVTVVHSNSEGQSTDVRQLVVTPTAGTPITVSLPNGPANSTQRSDTVSLLADDANVLANQIHDGAFSGATVTYSATLGHKGIEYVDSIQLQLTYAPPAFRSQRGCVTQPGFNETPTASSCAFFTTIPSSNSAFHIQGTTYAPLAALNIFSKDPSRPVMGFGTISRAIRITVPGNMPIPEVVVQTPADSPGYGFGVFLSTYICDGPLPCATIGSPNLTALVAFDDTGSTPVAGARGVRVLSWSNR